MVGKGNLAVFESSNISETEKVTPTKIGVYALYIVGLEHDLSCTTCAHIHIHTCSIFIIDIVL